MIQTINVTQPPLLRLVLGGPPPASLCGHHIYIAPSLRGRTASSAGLRSVGRSVGQILHDSWDEAGDGKDEAEDRGGGGGGGPRPFCRTLQAHHTHTSHPNLLFSAVQINIVEGCVWAWVTISHPPAANIAQILKRAAKLNQIRSRIRQRFRVFVQQKLNQ